MKYTKTMTRTRTPYGVTRSVTKSRSRRRRIKGRGLFSWMGKAGKWLSRNVVPHALKAGKTALKVYSDPNVRGIADQYAGTKAKKYMKKADKAIEIGNILKSASGNGRRRRTVRMRRKKKSCHCKGGSLGGSLGNYGRGLGGY